MPRQSTIMIQMFGALHMIRKERGLASAAEVVIPPGGRTARDIARELDLPFEKIEGVFVNHVVYDLGRLILPGDRVAFVPTGVPGPHRYMLGVHQAGKAGEEAG
jgi:hypothetical protein